MYDLHSGHPPPLFLKEGGLRFKPKFQKKGGGGVKIFWIIGGLSLREGVKISRGGGGFLDIIFHPFQILFLVSLNR